jgi:uncharacterized PurR-regulated membrane protein YhhQ (DUF165 family)
MRSAGTAAVATYIACIVAANVLTQRYGLIAAGFGLYATAGTFAAGFALLARDAVQRFAGQRWVAVAIAVGILLSALLASPALAVASCAAFAIAELADWAVYTAARRRRGFAVSAAASNIVSAPADTLAFLALAGFPITWQTVGGQLLVKLIYATALPLLILTAARHALLREPVDPLGA